MESSPIFLEPDFLRKVERLRLVAKRLAWSPAKGEHPSARRGFSLEFSDYRKYQGGDDLRYVDWNIYRRLDRLWLKLFTAEEEMNIFLLVDASRSMAEGNPPKLEYAKKVAAALGYIGLKNLDKVGGAGFSEDVIAPLSLGRGKKQILSLFSFLSHLSSGGETAFSASIRSFTRLFPRPGLVVLLSDLFDPRGWRAGLEALRARRPVALRRREPARTQAIPRRGAARALSGRARRLLRRDRIVLPRPRRRLPPRAHLDSFRRVRSVDASRRALSQIIR